MTKRLNVPGRRALLTALPLLLLAGFHAPAVHAAFDHGHRDWDALLKQHVVVAPGGNASTLRYAGLQARRNELRAYLASLSAVSTREYGAWTGPQQLAFLANAYNAYTVELVLTRYPDLQSIRDLGGLLQSPWKKKFFRLLEQERSLDELEHGMIRAPGIFDDPRIHAAMVCASIGCPMLRNEAFVAERLDAQLDDALRRFLSDRSRNRFDGTTGTLAVSKIFDWYRRDFEQGHKGYDSLQAVFARHADSLANTPQTQGDVRAGRYKLAFLNYDWALNDVR
ncbi:DUF547 domain-containing protein [Polaromonas sp. AET17H-212]|uniref:DUF547 domain-containing protein n=1 Tax=Polaromonas sp. AET17H-212 TaxID=1977061 RepID=UPI001C3EE7CA|nr:DUF547 domain-containing protein [Polaromonas sp. AET17H-212]